MRETLLERKPEGENRRPSLSLRLGNGALSLFIFLLLNVGIVQSIPGLDLYNLYDLHRFVEIILLAIVAGLIIFSTPCHDVTFQSYERLPFLAKALLFIFFGLGLMSSLIHPTREPFPLLGLSSVCHLAMLVLMILYVAGLYFTYPHYTRKLLGTIILLSGGYYLLIEWTQYLKIQHFLLTNPREISPDEWIPLLRFPQFSNPRFLAQVLSAALPVSILPYLYLSDFKAMVIYRSSALYLLLPIGLWELFWMNQSRALYLELIATGLLLPLIFKNSPSLKRYLKIQGFCAAIGWLLYQIAYPLLLSLPSRSWNELMEPGRLFLWKSSLLLIKHHPLTGVGPLNFLDSIEKKFNVSHPHNALLWIACEWGVPAVMIFVGLLGWAFSRWIRIASSAQHPVLHIALTAALFSTGINAQFSGTLLMPASQVVFALTLGVTLGVFFTHTTHHCITLKFHRYKLKILVICLMTGLFSGITPLLPQLAKQEKEACIGAFDEKHPTRCPIIPGYFAMHSAVE